MLRSTFAIHSHPSRQIAKAIACWAMHGSADQMKTPTGFSDNICRAEPTCLFILRQNSAQSLAAQRAAAKDLAIPNPSREVRTVCCHHQLNPPLNACTIFLVSDQVRCIVEGASERNVGLSYALKPSQHQYRDLTSESEFQQHN